MKLKKKSNFNLKLKNIFEQKQKKENIGLE